MELYPYQETGVEFLVEKERCLLADEMGLGKTVQALRAAEGCFLPDILGMEAQNVMPPLVLVVCPACLRINWHREIAAWSESTWPFVVISYNELLSRDDIFKINWRIIICDEAHRLKNWSSKWTRKFLELQKKTGRLWLLTGTPLVRSAADLHSLYSFIEPGKWGKYKDFCDTYCYGVYNKWTRKTDYNGFKNHEELKERSRHFILRRTKKEVLSELPEKIYTKIPLELAGCAYYDDGTLDASVSSGSMAAPLATIRKQLGIKKIGHAIEWLNLFSEPCVVFCYHREVAEELATKMHGLLVLGGLSDGERQKRIDAFQNGEKRILVATIGSIGLGVTLTSASTCLFVEKPWSFAEKTQAEDRLHRIGQKYPVNIYEMVVLNSLDEAVENILSKKKHYEEKLHATCTTIN